MVCEDMRVYATPHDKGMAIYINTDKGSHFVMTHRRNSLLYNFLRDGKKLSTVRAYKPSRNKREQQFHSSLKHIATVTEWVYWNEVA